MSGAPEYAVGSFGLSKLTVVVRLALSPFWSLQAAPVHGCYPCQHHRPRNSPRLPASYCVKLVGKFTLGKSSPKADRGI